MLLFVGLSHARASLDLRERCAVPVEERERVRAELRRRFPRGVLLSTCGRIELYVDDPDPDAAEHDACAWLARRACEPAEVIAARVEAARGEDAVRRVVRVACGLESAVEGEDEILGQVRRAWLDAGAAGMLSPTLDAALRLAVRTGRQARRLGDAHAWTSFADTAAAHVALAVGDLPAPTVLIAGSGPMGLRAALSLRAQLGPDLELEMAGRTPERVIAHAARADARPLGLDAIPAALDRADAAIVGLRTRQALIGAQHISPRVEGRPLLIVDLSLPRAVENSAAEVAGVTLRNVDDLGHAEGGSSRWSADDRAQVEERVTRALRDHAALTERSDATATLAALRMRADGVRRSQLERTLRRLPHLDAETRWAIDALTRAIVNRVLHDPTMRLKSDADGAVTGQVRELFGMGRQ